MHEHLVAACDKADWTPMEALEFYAAGKHFDTPNGMTRILSALAELKAGYDQQRNRLLEVLKAILSDGIHCDVVPHLHVRARAVIAELEAARCKALLPAASYIPEVHGRSVPK